MINAILWYLYSHFVWVIFATIAIAFISLLIWVIKGDAFPYMEWFRKNYGQAALTRLHRLYETPSHFKDYDLKEMYEKLQKQQKLIINRRCKYE